MKLSLSPPPERASAYRISSRDQLIGGPGALEGDTGRAREQILGAFEHLQRERCVTLLLEIARAARLQEVNCALYRESADCRRRLAAFQLALGRHEDARRSVERAIRGNDDRNPAFQKPLASSGTSTRPML